MKISLGITLMERQSDDTGEPSYVQAYEAATSSYLARVLKMCDGRVTIASRIAGVHRSVFHRTIKRLGVPRITSTNQRMIIIPVNFETLEAAVHREMHDYFTRLIKRSPSITHAAAIAKENRTHMYKLLRRYNVDVSINPRRQNRGNAEWQALGT